jgi:hypothetical protein
MTRLKICGALLALVVLVWPQGGFADSKEGQKTKSSANSTNSESSGGLLDGVGDLFGGGEAKPEIDRLDGDENFAGIAANRPLSLRLLYGYGTGIVSYPGFTDYANQVLARLVAAAPVKNLPVHAYVVASGNFNAASMPCGAIAVDWGLLRGLQNEDELAFVLAHEMGHVVFRHHEADYFVDAQHYAVTSASITDALADKAGAAYGFKLDSSGDLGRAIQIGRIVEKVSEGVLLPAWTRKQEDVADRFGIDLMIRAGYNPAAALSFFNTLAAWEKQQEKSGDDKLGAAVAQQLDSKKNGTTLNVDALVDDLLSFGDSVASAISEEDHYPASQRQEKIQKYIGAFYAEAEMPPLKLVPWRGGSGNKIAKAHGQFVAAYQAFQNLDGGKLGDAERLASVSVAGAMTSEGFPRFALYMVRLGQGKKDKAKASLDSALKAPKPGVTIFQARIRMAETESKLQEAAAFLDDARRRLDDPPALLPDRIRIYPKVGRQNEVTPLLIECQLQWRKMAKKCASESDRLAL